MKGCNDVSNLCSQTTLIDGCIPPQLFSSDFVNQKNTQESAFPRQRLSRPIMVTVPPESTGAPGWIAGVDPRKLLLVMKNLRALRIKWHKRKRWKIIVAMPNVVVLGQMVLLYVGTQKLDELDPSAGVEGCYVPIKVSFTHCGNLAKYFLQGDQNLTALYYTVCVRRGYLKNSGSWGSLSSDLGVVDH